MELLYHYIWKYRLIPSDLRLCDGRSLKVCSPGLHNSQAGPDFSHARLEIDGQQWVGNVEIHVHASDWHRHGHDSDPAYDNIVLHVVAVDDTRILRRDGTEIPQVAVSISPEMAQVYSRLCSGIDAVRCEPYIKDIPELNREDWLESLSVERLHFKAERIKGFLKQFGGDWRQAIFVALCRSLGFGLNGVPFEIMAKSLPFNYLLRHGDSLRQIEALLFGQAGMLDPSCNIFDEYYQGLCREYRFLSAKYGLKPIDPSLWKYARSRPQNFPHRRIAVLAAGIHSGLDLTGRLLEAEGREQDLMAIFDWEASEYWRHHSSFGSEPLDRPLSCSLSKSSRVLLLINLVAPFYAAYGSMRGDVDVAEKGLDLLMALPSEENVIVRRWRECGIRCNDALRSQALIHLRSEYCDRSRCLDCRFSYIALRPHPSASPS